MKQGGRVYIIMGVVLAVLAGGLLFVWLVNMGGGTTNTAAVTPTPPPPVTVVVASKDVTAGTILTGDMIKTEQRSVAEAGTEAVRTPSEALDRVVVMPVKAGTPLKQSDIQTIPFVLPKGKRAMALPVDDMSTVAGLVREKDFVDVVVTGKVKLDNGQDAQGTPGARPTVASTPQPRQGADSEDLSVIEPVDNQTVVKAVIQRVEVLKVVAPAPPQENRQEQAPPDVPPATATAQARARAQTAENRGRISGTQGIIVLAVSNQEAEILRYARDAANFQLLLRGRDDADKEDTKGMTLDILIRDYGLPVPKPVVVDLRPE